MNQRTSNQEISNMTHISTAQTSDKSWYKKHGALLKCVAFRPPILSSQGSEQKNHPNQIQLQQQKNNTNNTQKKTNNKIKWHNIFELPKKIVLHFWFERFFPKFFPFALRDLRFRWWIVTTGSSSGTVSVTLHGVPRLQHRFSFLGIRRGRLQLRLLHRRGFRSDLRSDLLAVATCWGVQTVDGSEIWWSPGDT